MFGGVKVKPGKPVIFGKTDKKVMLGLPGNPTLFIVSSYFFLFPILKKISGHNDFLPKLTCYVEIMANVSNTLERERFIFVKLEEKEGKILAYPILG
ncbi:MAG: hypothetical protein H0Z24_07145 [Thermosipho sp. (in: Bacteria)]|nr:hypothetical protein [Thermosipho sp. (in: thermotogales)]